MTFIDFVRGKDTSFRGIANDNRIIKIMITSQSLTWHKY